MKFKVFYHANCADGFGAAWAVWNLQNDTELLLETEFIPMHYGTIKSIIDVDLLGEIKGCEVFILDFSFPREVMDYIIQNAQYTTWFDHHKTAFEMWVPDLKIEATTKYSVLTDKLWIELDNARSGARITWEELDDRCPDLIAHIDDYDRWQFKLEGTKEIIKGLWAKAPWSFEAWHDSDMHPFKLVKDGELLLAEHNRQVEAAIKHPLHIALINNDQRLCEGWAVNAAPNLASDAGHLLAKRDDTFGMTYHIDNELRVKVSLRSTGDYDVSAIAKYYGGGGHKNAAGFELRFKQFQTILGLA